MQLVKLFFNITLIIVGLFSSPTLLLAESSDLPAAPDRGTPEDESSPGGTRIDKDSTCNKTKKPLTSLLGIGDFTLSKYPTFWFYIPYTFQEISYLEFTLKDTPELKTIYQTAIELTNQPGIIKITIPNEEKYALEIHTNYSWELVVYCASKPKNKPDITLTGSLRRIAITPQLENQLNADKSEDYTVYINNYIYYDAVTDLSTLHFANPDDLQLDNVWNKLLELLGKKQLVDEPLVNVLLSPPQEQSKANFRSR